MKKRILAMAAAIILCLALCSCGAEGVYNKQVFDTTYSFNKAILSLPNGEIVTGKVQSWLDFDDSDQIQVTIDGVTYLVFSSNIVLISE